MKNKFKGGDRVIISGIISHRLYYDDSLYVVRLESGAGMVIDEEDMKKAELLKKKQRVKK